MKSAIKKSLQKILGYKNYLFVFSIYIIFTLKWNKKEGDFLHFLDLIPDKDTILDIGANIGIMTVHLARSKPNADILAIEPMPSNLEALQRVLKFFKIKNAMVLQLALGDKPGNVEMVLPVVDNVKMQGLSHVVHESIDSFNDGNRFEVKAKTLDQLAGDTLKDCTIRAIKMDVENFEYFVLKGGEELIKLHRPIIYTELWENENRDKCFEFIRNLDYSIKILEKAKLVDFDTTKHSNQNFFFLPR